MKKTLIISLTLSFASTALAEDVAIKSDNPNDSSIESSTGQRTVIHGNTLATRDENGNTVTVNNIDNTLHKASELMGKGIGAATEMNMNIARAVGGSVPAELNAPRVSTAGRTGAVQQRDHSSLPPLSPGRPLPGTFKVGISSASGAESYSNISDVTIFKDGQVYQETSTGYNYTGSISFRTPSGEIKHATGTIALSR
jgi:hypothetical protein